MSKEFQIRDGNLIASFDLENEDGDIDFCKLLKVSHGVADEIGIFVDYVATNKIIKDQSKQISDLEAKLAELESDSNATLNEYRAIKHENKQLKEQLAESKKQCQQCKHLNKKIELNIKNKLMSELAEKEKEIDEMNKAWVQSVHDWKVLCKKKDQDKISFAVEQLEKVKDFLFEQNIEITRLNKISDFIDNQIKQLKEGK